MDYTIKNSILQVIISSMGAEVQSIKSQHSGFEYIWQADPKVWRRHAPILFPFVGKLKNDQYTYQGKTYHMGQHGFARDMEFTVEHQTSESITFLLTDTNETRKIYPFSFELRVNYNLLNNLLEENFSVINKSNGQMIFGIGGHPGFNIPTSDLVSKEDFYFSTRPSLARIQIPISDGLLDWDNRSLASTNSLITLSDHLFKNDALVFQLKGHDNRISLRTETSDYHINVWLRDAPFVGVWSQYPNFGDYVCIEPWWGVADRLDFNGKLEEKYGMNHLEDGETFTAGFSMAFHDQD
ncbi:aldose 1-epimerase family protein [Lactobacillus sp. ESL0228]|uniref:aldose 1-epimerase family protein n=1 Tax=Lactobacillus sp. ESL0228 TaxID=2069352 RepID=UPI000EFD483B|nr:aldose 1-epimerase family protein [Lactobacillus sp. ESL0228]RMC48774.1 aldose 1-epimerase family protein [Lactobacillus sp. ESL0228]